MTTYTVWQDDDHISDVHDNGPNYMYSLICDYEKYVSDFGYVSINTFLHGWSCIPRKFFMNLQPGCHVYDPNGICYRVVECPYEAEDEINYYVEVVHIRDDGTISSTTEILSTGDLYGEPHVHYDYQWKKHQLKESEEKACPILITKTSQLQS